MSAPPASVESREWLNDLRAGGAAAAAAHARLHALLLRAASFEVDRRVRSTPGLGAEAAEIALEAADEALNSVSAHLDDFRGDTSFTTWVSKFALVEAAVRVRRRAWEGRELPPDQDAPTLWPSPDADADLEQGRLHATLESAIERLGVHERRVLVALAVNGVPIDVLAERLGTTRGALYDTLHDARRLLRRHVAASASSA